MTNEYQTPYRNTLPVSQMVRASGELVPNSIDESSASEARRAATHLQRAVVGCLEVDGLHAGDSLEWVLAQRNDDRSAEDRYLHGDLDFEDAVREVTGADIDRAFFAQIVHSLSARNAAGPTLSEHDASLLADAGFATDPAAATAARMDRDIRMQDLVRSSLPVADAAERLGVTTARVRQRLSEGTLWAFVSGRHRLLPPAQFTATGAVPHLERVMPLLARDLHPLTVQTLLTEPQPSLVVEGRPVSITAWLTGSAGTATDIEQVADVITAATWESA